jgi:hypothetical protein
MNKLTEAELQEVSKIVWTKYEQYSTNNYAVEISEKIRHLFLLTNVLHVQRVPVNDWNLWTEPVIFKFCYHASSLLKLLHGTELPYDQNGRKVKIFDEPSIFVLFRSMLENYLTFFYLFVDNVSEQEKYFRLLVWKYAATKQRSEFDVENDEEAKKRLEQEKLNAQQLRAQIESSPVFLNLPAGEKTVILRGRKPRLINGWQTLIESANLRSYLFKNLYSYKSSYSHSEFLSVLQIKQGRYGFNPNAKEHYLTIIIHALICKAIIDMASLFPAIKAEFQKLPVNVQNEILFLNMFCMNDISTSSTKIKSTPPLK